MKNSFPFILVLAGGVLLVAWWLVFSLFSSEDTVDTTYTDLSSTSETITLPENQLILSSTAGGNFPVNNFLDNASTIPDTYNPGAYFLGYSVDMADAPYVIQYIEATDQFTITLLKEPLAEVRYQAETFLQSALGIDEAQMCNLKYTLTVPWSVSEYVSGYSLGFSFCPGAAAL